MGYPLFNLTLSFDFAILSDMKKIKKKYPLKTKFKDAHRQTCVECEFKELHPELKKAIKEKRKICSICGAKRYIKDLYKYFHDDHPRFECKNTDLCVLKMSFNKKRKKICVGKISKKSLKKVI